MNSLLQRQLKKYGLSETETPSNSENWQGFLNSVERTYKGSDDVQGQLDSALEKSTQEMLRLNRELVDQKAALDRAAAVFVVSPEGNLVKINENLEALSGYLQAEVLGRPFSVLCSSDYGVEFFDGVLQSCRLGIDWKGEIKCKSKAGDFYWVDATFVPVKDPNQESFQIISIQFNISNRKRAENLLAGQHQKMIVTEKFAALGEMSGEFAHEINTPLGAISLEMESLRDQLLKVPSVPQSSIKTLESAFSALEMTIQIVQGFRDFSRDGGNDEQQLESPVLLLDKSLLLTRDLLRKRGIKLEVLNDLKPGANVLTRGMQLCQVFLNLIRNASDAIEALPEKWIRIHLRSEETRVLISITDSGGGIPAEIRDRLFQPYFTTKPSGKGTGIGLPISREIVIEHGGSLEINPLSAHTEFLINIPLVKAELTNTLLGDFTPLRRALVVDDVPDLADAVRDCLEELGWSVRTAYGGAQALEHLEVDRFDLVISDLYMPDFDGVAILKVVRNGNRTPFILMSGNLPDNYAAVEAGSADGFLKKPFIRRDLINLVEKVAPKEKK